MKKLVRVEFSADELMMGYERYCYRDGGFLEPDGPVKDLIGDLSNTQIRELLNEGHLDTDSCCDTYKLYNEKYKYQPTLEDRILQSNIDLLYEHAMEHNGFMKWLRCYEQDYKTLCSKRDIAAYFAAYYKWDSKKAN